MKLVEILRRIKIDYRRVIAGLILFVAELCLFFGSGALLQDEMHMLTGEGSWDVALSDTAPGISQEFVPAHSHLKSVSFRMDLSGLSRWDNSVIVAVKNKDGDNLFEKCMDIQEITDGAYTDVEVNLELSVFESYCLFISATPTSAGEYPVISVCSTDYKLPESRKLIHEEEIAGGHLVSRYQYVEALTVTRAIKAILLCALTAAGVMFGLPRNPYVRRGAGVLLLLVTPYVLGQRLELLSYNPTFYLPDAMRWNVGIMYALEFLVLLVTHSAAISIVLTNVALTLLYSANYFMLMYRGTSLRVNDFTAIGTAAGVVGEYDLTPNSHLAFVWAMVLLIVVFAVQTRSVKRTDDEKEKSTHKRTIPVVAVSYIVTIAMAAAIGLYGGHKLLYTDYLYEKGFADKDLVGFEYELIYAYNGYLVGTCIEVKSSRIVKPEYYSPGQVEEILMAADKEHETAQELPHVILIMNESLSDIRTLADVELSQENMPFLNSLKENTLKGYVNASTFGGGTANAEFEVFTGCSMAFLPVNYYPYQQAMRRPVESMISQMKEYGYTAIAMHPEKASNWNRRNVYNYLGFDRMLFEQDFEDAEIIHSGVSDAETYNRIIELYENRGEEEKLFIFDLTMQNHGGYEQSEEPDEIRALNLNEPQIDEYLSLVKISDEAFGELVGYFEKQNEKVIICMFGDHQPWIFDLVADEGLTDGNAPSERMMNKYRTPFVIWANYDIQEAEGYDISMNYLGGLLMKTAGIPMSPYFNYLDKLCEEYPIITINGYVDSEGNYSVWSTTGDEFPEYRMLQYNYLFDNDTVEWGY